MRFAHTRSSSASASGPSTSILPNEVMSMMPDPLAERLAFDGEAVELRRPRPAVGALVLARPPPRLPRPVVVGPLPAVLRAVDGAEILGAAVHRRDAAGPAPLRGVQRVAEAVVVLGGLAPGGRERVRMAVRPAEAPGPVAVHVPLGLARRDPLGDGLADPAGVAEPVQREPGRHPEPGHAWHRAEQRV